MMIQTDSPTLFFDIYSTSLFKCLHTLFIGILIPLGVGDHVPNTIRLVVHSTYVVGFKGHCARKRAGGCNHRSAKSKSACSARKGQRFSAASCIFKTPDAFLAIRGIGGSVHSDNVSIAKSKNIAK